MNAQPHSGCGLRVQGAVIVSSGLGRLGELGARVFCQIKANAAYPHTNFADPGEFVPKGFDGAVRLYEVRWQA